MDNSQIGRLLKKQQEELKKENFELERLYDWLKDENREPAQTKFTAGLLRNVAREIEFLIKNRIMKEELVSFKTAKLAKEKGLCNFFKNINGTEYVPTFYSEDGEHFEEVEFQQEDCVIEDRYFRPTQTLLQKWLREVHFIEVGSYVNFYNKKPKLGYYYSIDRFNSEAIHDGKDYDDDQLALIGSAKGFDTYEEALEKGLYLALKLI